jgi:hypothetical protein
VEQPHISGTNLVVERFKVTDDKVFSVTAYAERACSGWIEITHKNCRRRFSLGEFADPQVKTLSRNWELILEDENALLLQDWKVRLDYEGRSMEEVRHEPDYDDSGWASRQCGPLVAFAEGLPSSVWYRSRFMVKGGSVTKMLLDGISGRAFEVFVNGETVKISRPSSKLDVNIGEVDLRGIVRLGENVIAVRIEPVNLGDGLLDPVRILGTFSVSFDGGVPTLSQLGKEIRVGKSWTEQGLPYYSGSLTYRKSVYLPASFLNKKKIMLDCSEVKDNLEIEVNGSVVAVRLWPPYVVDVTKHLKQGANEIRLRVTNTATNIITGKQMPSGLLGPEIKLIAFDLRDANIDFR